MERNMEDGLKAIVNRRVLPLIAEAFIHYDAELTESRVRQAYKPALKKEQAKRLKQNLSDFIDKCVELETL